MSDFSFDFDSLVESTDSNPFVANKKSFEADSRFYTLTKDADGDGQALIAFLPDPEKRTIQQVFKFNINNHVNGSKRFINMFSPTTCGQPDPIQEEWQRLWNAGRKDEAKRFSRSVRYVTNIKVIKDPSNPENEGKVFLYEMSGRLFEKLKQALCPSDKEIALGATRKEIFNPMKGWVFKLAAKKQPSGMISYDASEFVYKPELQIYDSVESAVNDIKEHGHKLSWFLDPANYPTYDEILDKLKWMNGETANSESPSVKVEINDASPESEIQDATPTIKAKVASDSIDDAIDELLA